MHVSVGFANQVQPEIVGMFEDDASPSSAYVYQITPRPHTRIPFRALTIGIEYT
jgi:hypothetical protein